MTGKLLAKLLKQIHSQPQFFNKKFGEGGIVLVARVRRVCGFCFKELHSFRKKPSLSARFRSNPEMLRIGVRIPQPQFFNKKFGEGGIVLVARVRRVCGFCFKELHSFRKKPSLSARFRSNPEMLRIGVRIPQPQFFNKKFGEGGIRTRGGLSPSQIFEICTLNRSDTSP